MLSYLVMRDPLSFYEHAAPHSPLSIISVPTELGSDARGLRETPRYLAEHGLARMLRAIGAEVAEEITIPCPEPQRPEEHGPKFLAEIAAVSRHTAAAVAAAAGREELPLVLGGDHSAAIGGILGAREAHPSLGVIYIDAHPDVHTHETTRTRNVHGMVAALALGHGHPALLRGHLPIRPEHFLFIGLKDFEEAEIEFLRREGPGYFTMFDISRRGLAPVCTAIIELAHNVDRVWVSLDMDTIDALDAPGVAMPNDAGLTAREALSLAQCIGKTCTLAGVDLVELLPRNDIDCRTAGLALELTARLLGGEYSWWSAYLERYQEKQPGEIT